MNKSQQVYAVSAICLSIIMAGALIAYRPGVLPEGIIETIGDYRSPRA